MKRLLLISALACLSSGLSLSALAQEPPPPAAPDAAPPPGDSGAAEEAAAVPPPEPPPPPPPPAAVPPLDIKVEAPKHDGGLNLHVTWADPPGDKPTGYVVLRSDSAGGPWVAATDILPPETHEITDKVTTDPAVEPPRDAYFYRVVALGPDAPAPELPSDEAALAEAKKAYAAALATYGGASAAVEGNPEASWFQASVGHVHLLALILAIGGLTLYFSRVAQSGKDLYIRRISGIDAIEEGIGRATEMGRPVLYVPGIDELQDIQTIASMLILGQVGKKVAEYQSDIIVACCIPIVREVSDEVLRAGYYQAGYPDAYNSANTRFISSDQFAFCAGTNGIILREKPATNIYLGRFFAESLILAETGFINRSIQIAGTAEATQLPFFVAACDYTLIGEELFATSAYLSKDPRLVSSLKASDYVKLYCVLAILLGTVLATLGVTQVVDLFTIAE